MPHWLWLLPFEVGGYVVYSLFVVAPIECGVVLGLCFVVLSRLAIILLRKRELVALL